MQPVVAYYRVSTERHGRSGLGLDAQRERCAVFAAQSGMEVVEAFTEVETGKGADALDRSSPRRWPPHGATAARCWWPNSTGYRATCTSSPAGPFSSSIAAWA